MNTLLNPELASDLQFALDVMEERAHLGLDDKIASDLKDILLRHIKETNLELEGSPSDKGWNDSWESQVTSYTTRLARLRSAESRSERRTRSK